MTRPIATPPIAALIGTPASMSASVEPHVEAIDVEPFEERTSDTTRIVYGNSSFDGTTGRSARSASAPCPISRRPGPRSGRVSPTEYGGEVLWGMYRFVSTGPGGGLIFSSPPRP